MRAALIGAVAGWLIGAMVAGALYCVGHLLMGDTSGFTFYGPYASSSVSGVPSARQIGAGYVMIGAVLGGGPGAVAGAVIGAAGALLGAIRQHGAGRPEGPD